MSVLDQYEDQIDKLLSLLDKDHPQYLDALNLSTRLKENIQNTRSFGETAERTSTRAQILSELNRMTLALFREPLDNLPNEVDQIETLESSFEQPDQEEKKRGIGNKVFISHSGADKEFVIRLSQDLKKSGYQVWYAGWEIKVGQSIVENINQGLANSSHLIFVLSPDSVKSKWAQQELNTALIEQLSDQNITILPVLYRDCEIPLLLRDILYADMRSDYRKGFTQLLDALEISFEGDRKKSEIERNINRIEQLCYNRDFSTDEIKTLSTLLREITMAKKKGKPEELKVGDDDMLPQNTEELFFHSSRTLGHYLIQLENYRSKWPDLILTDDLTERSLDLLDEMKDQVLRIKLYVDEVNQDKSVDLETTEMISAIRELKNLLKEIDQCLIRGEIPFNISDSIEKYFGDTVYFLSRYLLLLDELSRKDKKDTWVQ